MRQIGYYDTLPLFLKVLVVFHGFPITAPPEAVSHEEFVAEVLAVNQFDRLRFVFVAVVGIVLAVGGLHKPRLAMHTGIITGIDVHCHAETVF